jgi:prevent-host-death family protein
MKVVNVQEAKTHLSHLMEVAAGGEVVLIGKYGKPMVKLSAYAPHLETRPLGGFEGKIRISESFDDEDAQVNALFYGKSK